MSERGPGAHVLDPGQFRFLLEGTPDGVLVVDGDGCVVLANAQAHTLLGYAMPELEGMAVEMLIPGPLREAHRAHRARYQHGPRRRRMSTQPRLTAMCRDGRERFVDIGLAPLESEGLSLVSVTIRDASADARAATEASIVQAAEEGIWVVDARGNTRFVNRVFADLLGYRVDELEGMPYPRVLEPADRALATSVIEREGGAGGRGEIRLRTHDGATRWVLVSASPLVDAGSDAPDTLLMVTDITDRHHMEAALRANQQDLERLAGEIRALNDALEQRVEERTAELEAFCHAVTNDLRGPVRSIASLCDLLLDDGYDADGPETGIILGRVRANAWRVDELIRGLTGMTRLEDDALAWELVDLSALSREIATELVAGSPSRKIDLQISPAPMVHGDPRQLRLALDNLLRNAWKFTADRVRPRIEFGAQRDGDRQVWYVRDNGAGFDPEDRARLFKPFQRLHAEAHFRGAGLGLVTVRRVVERHGGRVWAEGALGRGATFFFTLGAPPRETRDVRG